LTCWSKRPCTFTATTNYLRIADGYILYSTEVSKETVTLSGPSSELSKVATCTAVGIL
jgi:YbbR-like protein.